MVHDGGIIDDSSVMLIINKLEMYIENEEKIVKNIEESLSILQGYYSGDNNSAFNSKSDGLIEALNTMLNNRYVYLESLKQTLIGYIGRDKYVAMEFNDGIN